MSRGKVLRSLLGRLLAMLLLVSLCLQLFFVAKIALMAVLDPASTSYQRSEAARLALSPESRWRWRQQWVDLDRLPASVMRAVLASEDAGFVEHSGVEWEAIEKAWQRNRQAEERAERASRADRSRSRPPRLRGGSTITQQLAKNLLLSGERTLARKGQELLLAWMLELMLSKRRILEIYLNHVEWGEGVFGIQAAAQHYFRVDATRLSAEQSARLAVMLPAPKRFEKRPHSAYVQERAATILARMPAVALP